MVFYLYTCLTILFSWKPMLCCAQISPLLLLIRKGSISVEIQDDDSGCISAHTCANTISLPVTVPDFQLFTDALMAVIDPQGKSFNMV